MTSMPLKLEFSFHPAEYFHPIFHEFCWSAGVIEVWVSFITMPRRSIARPWELKACQCKRYLKCHIPIKNVPVYDLSFNDVLFYNLIIYRYLKGNGDIGTSYTKIPHSTNNSISFKLANPLVYMKTIHLKLTWCSCTSNSLI